MASKAMTMVVSKSIATMKDLFTRLMLVAVAALSIVACQTEPEIIVTPEAKQIAMTILADVDDTRTVLDEDNYKVQWNADDRLRVIQTHTTTDSSTTTITGTTETTIDSNDKASFTVSFTETTADAFSYNAIYPYSSVVESGSIATNVKIIVKDAQTSTATSFDPEADILVSNTIESTVQPTSLNMRFARLVALGKLTLTGLPVDAEITKVEFTAGADDILTGRNYVDATTGIVSQYGYGDFDYNYVTINYNSAITSRDIYFTCNPFEMEAEEVFTVKVTCKDYIYTREVTIPAGRSLIFEQGNLNTFSVDMTTASKESNVAFPDGEYAVIAIVGKNYYALSSEANGSRLNAVPVTYTPGESLNTTDETLKWTIAYTDDGYTFKGSNNQYIAWSSGNSAKTQADVYYLDITEDGDTGRYNVTSKTDATRKLQRNATEAYSYFAFYTSTQSGSLYLVPIEIDTTPRFEVTPNEQSISADGDSVVFTVIPINNFTATVTATTEAEWLEISNVGYTYTATALANTGATREATITFSAEGYESVSVTVKQATNNVEAITIAEFIEKADTTTEYKLTGTISNVVNTTYGNFDLTDASGKIYVYGLYSPEGVNKYWSTAGVKAGDVITIQGTYELYNNTTNEVVNAKYVSHYGVTADKTSVSLVAEGGSDTVSLTLINTTEAISVEHNEVFTVELNDNTLTISGGANETGDAITDTISVKVGEAYTEIIVSQAAKSTGEEADAWTLVEDASTLKVDDQVVIVAVDYNYALSTTQNNNNRGQIEVTKSGTTVTINENVQILTLKEGTVDDTFAFYTGSGYLYAASSSSNHLKTQTTNNDNGSWKITIDNGVATIIAQGTNTRNYMQYNSTSVLFSCYASDKPQKHIAIYKLKVTE